MGTSTADARGGYLFGGLPLTQHHVRQELRPVPAPDGAGEQRRDVVILSPAINSVVGKDFGTRTESRVCSRRPG